MNRNNLQCFREWLYEKKPKLKTQKYQTDIFAGLNNRGRRLLKKKINNE